MCCTTRIGRGNRAGNLGRIAPKAVGPPVETPITTTFGSTFGPGLIIGPAGARDGPGWAEANLRVGCGMQKNCLILGINSSRRRAIERSRDPSFEALAT